MSALLLPALPARSAEQLQLALDHVIELTLSKATPPARQPVTDPLAAHQPGLRGPRQLEGRLPSRGALRQGGEALVRAPGSAAARVQRALIECAVLVAAADRLADEERSALERLLAHLTGQQDLTALLLSLEQELAQAGAAARLELLAASIVSFELREQALSFAALTAIADRELSEAEGDRLIDLGASFGFGVGEVQRVIDRVAGALAEALSAPQLGA